MGARIVTADRGIRASLFIDPDRAQLEASRAAGAPVVELHTGAYCDFHAEGRMEDAARELEALREMSTYAHSLGLEVHAGHGLTYESDLCNCRVADLILV